MGATLGVLDRSSLKESGACTDDQLHLDKLYQTLTGDINISNLTTVDLTGLDQLTDVALFMLAAPSVNPWMDRDLQYPSLDHVKLVTLTGCFHITDFGVWCITKACGSVKTICLDGCSNITEKSLLYINENCKDVDKVTTAGTAISFLRCDDPPEQPGVYFNMFQHGGLSCGKRRLSSTETADDGDSHSLKRSRYHSEEISERLRQTAMGCNQRTDASDEMMWEPAKQIEHRPVQQGEGANFPNSTSSQPCRRCIAGEPGHISHILR